MDQSSSLPVEKSTRLPAALTTTWPSVRPMATDASLAPSMAAVPDAVAMELASIAKSLSTIAQDIRRVADKLDPPLPVGTDYIARRLDCSDTWVATMARDGAIPATCIVAGTGSGKPWKFHRDKIDEWLKNR
jgi:hypothetical protein